MSKLPRDRRRPDRGQLEPTPELRVRFGVLAATLTAPSSVGCPTSVSVTLYNFQIPPGWSSSSGVSSSSAGTVPCLIPTSQSVTVYNFDPSLTGKIGAFVKIELIEGVWTFAWMGCPP